MKGLLDMSRKDTSRKGFETNFISGCPLRVLLVEDAPADAELALSLLQKHGYNVRAETVRTSEEFAASLGRGVYDVVLCDYSLPGWNGMEVLELLEKLQPELPFILITGALDDRTACQMIDRGADDYILKDRLSRLPLAVRRVLRERRHRQERKLAADERERLIQRLQQTLAEVKRLNGLLPVCVTCKRILDNQGFWSRMETYIESYSDVRVSASLCPECASRLYPEYFN